MRAESFPCPRCGRAIEFHLVPALELGDEATAVFRVEWTHRCPVPTAEAA